MRPGLCDVATYLVKVWPFLRSAKNRALLGAGFACASVPRILVFLSQLPVGLSPRARASDEILLRF